MVVGGRVFVGSSMGMVYSLDASTGCRYWKFQAQAGVRSAVVMGPAISPISEIFNPTFTQSMRSPGKLVWKTQITDHPYARVTDSPRLYQGRLYVGVSSREEWMASDPHYECCTFRGILVALDAVTGKQVWRTYTIPVSPQRTRKNQDGTQQWGPSGAGVWSSVTIDTQKKLLYAGIGNNYSDPATSGSDSFLPWILIPAKSHGQAS